MIDKRSITIGTLTLHREMEFAEYGASRTDYVACKPQTVELRYVDRYWCCAKFDGVLTTGQPAPAFFQAQAWGGMARMVENGYYSFEITNPAFALKSVGNYSDGKPMFAIQPR